MAGNLYSSLDVSEGVKTAPSAAVLLADTGAISESSTYSKHVDFRIIGWMETSGAAGATVVIEHRNAANDGNIRSMEVNLKPADNIVIPYQAEIADNERVRVIVGAVVPGAGIDVQVAIVGQVVTS